MSKKPQFPFFKENSLINRDTLTESEKWAYITDNTLKYMSFGFLCGGAISMIMFKSMVARASLTAYGAGCGIGKAYVDTKYILGHDVSAVTLWTAEAAVQKPDSSNSE
ncbi:hypothetical protein STCU_03167 [Strigomonas culicis]|uniref:MICOS complex subunit MIC10 n=1 Tax=Strigomonas culicis TaxID=28005 RepID=S9UR07_9TRYP|nr:hypothetical protein STCU_03571 [Strigomonas culicis]EPY31857.1 hypothetical protein STCU_03167 [Strigomonas culicis]|eukprot:EPY31204.1 hypothetical protein STCU_03571 [Strigomonas culicis]